MHEKIVVFTMILTFIFGMAGCNAHSEPYKKGVESSSDNTVIDTTQAEELYEKTINETVDKVHLRKKQYSHVQPYVLPFQKDLSAEDKRLSGGIENNRSNDRIAIAFTMFPS